MSIYYLTANIDGVSTIFVLDATETIQHKLPAKMTEHPVESGSNVADNIVLENETITFSGVISDIKMRDSANKQLTAKYITGLRKLRKNKQLFAIYAYANLPPLKNVFFEDLTISQDIEHGTLLSGRIVNFSAAAGETVSEIANARSRYKIDFTVRQVKVVIAGKEDIITADEISDITAKKEESSSSTEFVDPETKARDKIELGIKYVTGQRALGG